MNYNTGEFNPLTLPSTRTLVCEWCAADALALLIEYASVAHESHQAPALLTLRNLCFHATNKTKLLANGE